MPNLTCAMKKILYIIAAVAALAVAFIACQKTEDIVDPGKGGFKKGEKVTLTVSTGEQTKATSSFDESELKMNFKWEASDEILVKVGNDTAHFHLTSGAGDASASFTGIMPGDGPFYIQFPIEEPSLNEQEYVENGMPLNTMLFAGGPFSDGELPLEAQKAAVCFDFTGSNKTVGKVVVTINPPATSSNTYTLDCTDGDGTGKGVALSSTAKHFFMVLPASTSGVKDSIKVEVFDNASTKSLICSFSTKQELSSTAPLKMAGIEVKPQMTLSFSKGGNPVTTDSWDLYQTTPSAKYEMPTLVGAPDGANVTYASGNPEVASIVGNKVNPLAEGDAVITATVNKEGYYQGTATYKLTVTDSYVAVTAITLNKTETSITIGGTDALSVASWEPESPTVTTVKWTVENANPTGCVTVDDDGTVHAVKVGTATVKCTADGGTNVTATCAVTVNPIYVTAITLNKTKATIAKGSKETLSVESYTPSNPTEKGVTWSSADNTIATVNSTTGEVTAVGAGEVIIKCKANGADPDGSEVFAECTVTVNATYMRVNNVSEGTFLIVYQPNTGDSYAFCPIYSGTPTEDVIFLTQSADNKKEVTITSTGSGPSKTYNIISSNLRACEFTVSKSGNSYYYKLSGINYYLYLYRTGNKTSNYKYFLSANKTKQKLSFSSNKINNNNCYLSFSVYFAVNGSGTGVYLYKLQ